jgi:glutamate-1-semialdehyde aminotransferase
MSKTTLEIKSFKKSEEWLKRSLKVIPSASQTFSKGYTQYPRGASPLFLQRGKGQHVWDVDGNKYIDFPLALGPNILGYGDPVVDEAVIKQWKDGAAFTLPHPLEVEVAEMLVERIPCAEMVRFGKNGSDVTSAAVRLARAVTGREHVACCGYHGWQDWYIGSTTRSRGVPKAMCDLTHTFEYNKLNTLEKLFSENPNKIAAVIMEPVGVEDPEPGFLEAVKDLAHKHGALLIYDEVITGFRLARGGAQELYGVTPDIACFGKAMANGMPLSAVVGKRELMEVFDEIFFSFTYGGEAVSLAACKATLEEIDRRDVYKHMWRLGDGFRDAIKGLIKKYGLTERMKCLGPGPHTAVPFFDERGEYSLDMRALFQQELARNGILFLVGHNMSAAIEQTDLDQALEVYDGALAVMRDAVDSGDVSSYLKGSTVMPIFRKP